MLPHGDFSQGKSIHLTGDSSSHPKGSHGGLFSLRTDSSIHLAQLWQTFLGIIGKGS